MPLEQEIASKPEQGEQAAPGYLARFVAWILFVQKWFWPILSCAVLVGGLFKSPTLRTIAENAAELYNCKAFWWFVTLIGKFLVWCLSMAGYSLPASLQLPWYGWVCIWACLAFVVRCLCSRFYEYACFVAKAIIAVACVILLYDI